MVTDMGADPDEYDNAIKGEQLAEYIARQRDAEYVGNTVWFDVDDADMPVEVKSASKTLSSCRKGRFRLWLDQHANLKDHDGEYDLGFTDDGSTAAEVTLSPEEIDEVIEEKDLKWADSGQHPKGNRQLKLVWSYVIDPEEVA